MGGSVDRPLSMVVRPLFEMAQLHGFINGGDPNYLLTGMIGWFFRGMSTVSGWVIGWGKNQPPNPRQVPSGPVCPSGEICYTYVYHEPPKPTFLEVSMVNNLVFRWPKPLFSMVLGAHGMYIGDSTNQVNRDKTTILRQQIQQTFPTSPFRCPNSTDGGVKSN